MFVQSVLTVYPCQYTPIDSYVGNMVFDTAI